MASTISHSWDLSPAEAFALQKKLATPVIRETQLGSVTTVAGIDVGFPEGMTHAAVADVQLSRFAVN